MAISQEHRQFIIEYWYRTVLVTSNSILDILNIMIAFGDQYECFDEEISSKEFEYTDEFMILHPAKDKDSSTYGYGEVRSVYGKVDAEPGYKFHWILRCLDDLIWTNYGICQSKRCKELIENC